MNTGPDVARTPSMTTTTTTTTAKAPPISNANSRKTKSDKSGAKITYLINKHRYRKKKIQTNAETGKEVYIIDFLFSIQMGLSLMQGVVVVITHARQMIYIKL